MLTCKKLIYNSLHSFPCFDCALKHLQTHWPSVILGELQAQIHQDTSLDLQYDCVLFKLQFLGQVHTVLPNCLPGRKCSQETPWEHDIVECFTVLGEDRRASVECDLCVGLICRWLHLPFWNHPDLHSCYEQSEWAGALSASQWEPGQDLFSQQWLHVLCQQLFLLRGCIPHSALCLWQVMQGFSATYWIEIYNLKKCCVFFHCWFCSEVF